MIKSLGQIAFEAYKDWVSGQTYDNKPIPAWDSLTPRIRDAWEAGAAAAKASNAPSVQHGKGRTADD